MQDLKNASEVEIRLPDETVNYLQRLDYELGGLRVLHTHALNAGVPLERRMEIRREFQERFAEYQLAKQEMWAQFAPRFPRAKRWWVDFQMGKLHVEVRGDPTDAEESPRHAADSGVALPPLTRGAEGEVAGNE